MGRPAHEESIHNGFNLYLPDAFSAFPSPASITGNPLNSPNLGLVLNRTQSCSSKLHVTSGDGLYEAHILSTVPGDVHVEPVVTPLPQDTLEPNMDTVVGGALAPVPTTPPTPPPAPQKAGPGLRLPSFEELGIAAPRPDRVSDGVWGSFLDGTARADMQGYSNEYHRKSELVSAMESTETGSRGQDSYCPPPVPAVGRTMKLPLRHQVKTITPPAEEGALDWSRAALVQSAALDSPSTDPGNAASNPDEVDTPANAASTGLIVPVPSIQSSEDSRTWIDNAIDVILENIRTSPMPNGSLKILSHALPSTSTSGHIFSQVINSIQISTPSSPITPMTWINVFHAIPGRFNLADVPTSPPSTPGPPIGGEDYFTQKIFDSAVSISNYQEDVSTLPRSPRPVVPPSSIDVGIVERYIPPATSNEFAEMFDPNGSSILVDRLVELSPNNGSLLFIYPTKTGAQTFMRDYLGPILDPLLRTMAVVHGFPADLCLSLGNMPAVDHLLDHESLQRRIAVLCAKLTQRDTAARRLHGRQPKFSVSYASKQSVRLERRVWAKEWWTKQEKLRIKETVLKHHPVSQPRRSSSVASEYVHHTINPTELLQQILDGVAGKPEREQEMPEYGIEVSVFVIKRSE